MLGVILVVGMLQHAQRFVTTFLIRYHRGVSESRRNHDQHNEAGYRSQGKDQAPVVSTGQRDTGEVGGGQSDRFCDLEDDEHRATRACRRRLGDERWRPDRNTVEDTENQPYESVGRRYSSKLWWIATRRIVPGLVDRVTIVRLPGE